MVCKHPWTLALAHTDFSRTLSFKIFSSCQSQFPFSGLSLPISNTTGVDTVHLCPQEENVRMHSPCSVVLTSLEIHFLPLWLCYQFDIELKHLFPSIFKSGFCWHSKLILFFEYVKHWCASKYKLCEKVNSVKSCFLPPFSSLPPPMP